MFEAASKRFGGVDILINNAGICHSGLLSDMTDTDWDRVIGTNLSSVFYCSKKAIPYMVSKKSGSIVNVSSVWGLYGASCEVAYSASKGGMNAFTKALAKELAPSGIAVNALALGVIDTDMNRHLSDEDKKALVDQIPADRLGTPEEVADAVYHLSKMPTYLTGQIISMDGGWI